MAFGHRNGYNGHERRARNAPSAGPPIVQLMGYTSVTEVGINVNGKHLIPWDKIRNVEVEQIDTRRTKISIQYSTDFTAQPVNIGLSSQLSNPKKLVESIEIKWQPS
jgi:hypothetical protein